jgi:hypothetical protein
MKKSLLTQILVLSAALIVLTAVVSVNPALLPVTQPGSTLEADGVPLPLPEPPPPPLKLMATIDGVPLPLPEPPPPPPPHLMPTENQARSTNTMQS